MSTQISDPAAEQVVEKLRELVSQLTRAIAQIESGLPIQTASEAERLALVAEHGEDAFAVGDFVIKRRV